MTQRLDIAALRLQTELTGQLSAVQVQSVSSWPKVAFSEVKSYETRIDPETHEVEYVLTLKARKKIQDLRVLRIIEQSIWALLGDTWRTIFKIGDQMLYAGERRREIRNALSGNFGQGRSGFDPSRA